MNYIKNIKLKNASAWVVSVFMISVFLISCEFDLPEENSKPDDTPPVAAFGATLASDYLSYDFSNFSVSATDYLWDFGDGNTSTELEPSHTYAEMDSDEDEGGTIYIVKLTVSDKLNVTSTFVSEVVVIKPDKPILIKPEIKNGDFTDKMDNWKISNDLGATTNAFNSSSDGSSLLYDGTESGESKTPGAKWTSSTSVEPRTKDSRHAYQAIAVSPNAEYILEYEYAIKTDKTDHPLGDQVVVEILDGWYEKLDNIIDSTVAPLVAVPGDVANGKGNFETKKVQFTSNASGKVAIFIYAITKDELYVDNVKVYPAE